MTDMPFIIWSAVAAVVTLLLTGMLAAGELNRRRRRSRDRTLRAKYLRVVMWALMSGDGTVPRFPLLGRAGARQLLAETVAGVVGATYGLDVAPLRRIVAAYRLDEWLLRRAARSRGFRRARRLALLAQLPSDPSVAAGAARYARNRNPYVRFQALLVMLSADPSTALRLMADYPAPFSGCEVAEIMTVLRRGMLPIAYAPLLDSAEGNLRRIGVEIVRQFGIEEAEEQLLHIVAHDETPQMRDEALYALCSMRRPLARGAVARHIASMHPARRKALLRYMAAEGYSSRMLGRLFEEREQPYYESLVLSYKRTLACR